MSEEFLWVEKYRPRKVEDTILPKGLKKTFLELVENKELPNMIFFGGPGIGKTTVAKALCEQLELDYIVVNGSEDGNIDTLRGRIRQFASTVSLQGGMKVVILDEADYLNAQSTQPALRGFIEEFSKNCRFILTANAINRIIPALHSRCSVYDFNTPKTEVPALAGEFMTRLKGILDKENVKYDNRVLAELIKKYHPDLRRVIGECQRYGISGEIDKHILVNLSDSQFEDLFKFLKKKDFTGVRKWVVNNIDIDSSAIFRGIYNNISKKITPASIPAMVLIIADYQYKAGFVADQEINTVACLIEIMTDVEFK